MWGKVGVLLSLHPMFQSFHWASRVPDEEHDALLLCEPVMSGFMPITCSKLSSRRCKNLCQLPFARSFWIFPHNDRMFRLIARLQARQLQARRQLLGAFQGCHVLCRISCLGHKQDRVHSSLQSSSDIPCHAIFCSWHG